MNKKGFTLIELLSVIIILSLLMVLVLPKITNAVKNYTNKTDALMLTMIEDAAKLYLEDNIDSLEENEYGYYCVPLTELVNNNYLKEGIEISGEEVTFTKSVRVTYTDTFNYELIDISACTACKLVNDADNSNSITIGDKYQCKVKDNMEQGFEDGYYFFVLDVNEDTTIDLIMERNMYYDEVNDVGIVATRKNVAVSTLTVSIPWINEIDYGVAGGKNWADNIDRNMFGPITAMNYLYNATKDWANIPNVIIDYTDEASKGSYGYGTIKTINGLTKITKKDGSAVMVLTNKAGYTNLKARLPKYDEVHGTGKCFNRGETDEYGSCPLWLVNYLSNDSYVTGEGLRNIEGINGYWTLSSADYVSYSAWYVYHGGDLVNTLVQSSSNAGVRPVITISKNLISD